jgi:alkaline phosphatase
MKHLLTVIIALVVFKTAAQQYTTTNVFAHNDYVHDVPFYESYFAQTGFIEADVFLKNKDLMVAHTEEEIKVGRTLKELYLVPLSEMIRKNGGYAYADHTKSLTLMIDLKTEGTSTLQQLVKQLKKFPELLHARGLTIAVSGDMPDPAQWKQFPAFIFFDGRPGVTYTSGQWERIHLVSTDFKKWTVWNGKGVPVEADLQKIQALRDTAHAHGKQLRFWGAPDFNNAWMTLMKLKIDIIGTDHVNDLVKFIKTLPLTTYTLDNPYTTYRPAVNNTPSDGRPKNVILIIGDGMGLAQLYSGYTANRGQLNIFNIPNIGFSVTNSTDSYITDSAAGATAMATGRKTKNRFVGVDSLSKPLMPITVYLKQKGYATAIISNGDITDATPASFYAHQPERSWSEAIAKDFLSQKSDILMGAGINAFKNRKDNENILDVLKNEGYTVSEDVNEIDRLKGDKFIVIDQSAGLSKNNGRGNFLSAALKKSIETFQRAERPFFVMLEGAQIDHGGHANNLDYVVEEVIDLDKVVGEAMKYVDQNGETLLVITADHETGGLTLTGGDIAQGSVMGNFSTTDHTGVMVPVFAYGKGSALFRGVYSNTEIYSKILKALE